MMIYKEEKKNKSLALVVDDDPSLRMLMTATMRKINLDVIETDSGIKSLELFESRKPDIILMDVMMPDMNGFEACRRIRALMAGAYVQILMVTGLDDLESISKAFEAGADGFVTKPINLTMLGQRVQYMLRAGQAFREIHISQSRLAKTQELAQIGNWQVDLRNGEFYSSPEALRLLGLDPLSAEISLDFFFSSVISKDRHHVKENFKKALKAEEAITLEYKINDASGLQKHILNKTEIIFNEEAQSVLMLGIIQDISQLKQAEDEIRFLAFYDSLTGLANRMLFIDRLNQTIEDSKRHKKHFALLFLDLDHFKRINDTLGHHIGDQLLQKVSENIKKSIRSSDSATRLGSHQTQAADSLIARLGGDEFTILVTNLRNPESTAFIARRLLKTIPVTYTLEGHEVSITSSIGISVFPEDGNTAEALLKNADTAMYHAKDEGRNTYQFYRESMNKLIMERFSVDRDLRKAIKNDEFVLYYQPQLNLTDRKIVGAEALIRWEHPLQGMISPDKFIPVAEESGLIIDINQWVLRSACLQAKKWIDQGLPPITIGINLSGYKFAEQNIIQSINEVLNDQQLDGSNLEIELTENVLMQDTDATISTLKSIKDLNLRTALDDFGTGYSSLSYLASFPVDTLKIDRSFVMGDQQNDRNLIIIKAIIAMGHSLDKKVIAEGIETEEQYLMLKEFGCDEGQGYYFKHPVPADEFARLLEKTHIN